MADHPYISSLYIVNKSSNSLFYATSDAAGFDICANIDGHLHQGQYMAVPTGLFLDVERNKEVLRSGFGVPELQIRPRSGLAAKNGVTVLNSPGTIDCTYPGEIMVLLINHGKRMFTFQKGDRIAQGVVALVLRALNVEIKDQQRAGGLGSTGV